MTGCIYCKLKNVCIECDVGYVLTNNKCHSTCVSGTGYWSTDKKKCVSDCDAEDFGRKINNEKTKCVDACETDQWFDSTNNLCTECALSGATMGYCIKCDGVDSC